MEPEHQIVQLPKRIRGNYLASRSTPIKITSNYFPVRIKPIQKIYIFKIIFEPSLMSDNRMERDKLLKQATESIRKQIDNPVFGGMNIYSVSPPRQVQSTHETKTHKITVKQVKCFNVKENQKVFLHFLNNGIRTIMKTLDYIEIGDTGKYFNRLNKKNMEGMSLYPGYRVNFLMAEGGLYLRVDPTSKLVQNKTVLDYINDCYNLNRSKQRDQKRSIVKQDLINKIVMTNYGKTRYVKIQDIQFANLNEFKIQIKNQNLSILQYYQQKYNLKPRQQQPLLKIFNKNKKDVNPIYMLPQLCLMTGLPADIDQIKRKRISEETIGVTHEKYNSIIKIVDNMKKTIQENSLQQLGICIKKQPQILNSKIINNPTLYLGKENKVERGKQYQFNLFSQPIFQSTKVINLGIIYFDSNPQISQLLNTFTTTSKNLNVSINVKKFTIKPRSNRTSQLKNQIIQTLRGSVKQQCNLCLIVMRNDMRTEYKQIKRYCLENKKMITQVVLQNTLRKKGARSIHTKILLQIITKGGNVLWCPSIPSEICQKTMLVAFDTSSIGQKRKLVGVSTLNGQLTKFTSQSVNLDTIENKFKSMVTMIISFVNKFYKRNRENRAVNLEQIIVMTNSCPRNQIKLYYDYFIPHIKKQLAQINLRTVPNLTIIQAKDLSNQRFFDISEKTKSINNPPAGLIVSNTIVSQNYDFYMVSQKAFKGCSIPIRFNIVSSNSKLQQGIIQELLYSQCFGYANYTGSIKIPAIMQYAKKFARFSSEVLKANIQDEDMANRLYFI